MEKSAGIQRSEQVDATVFRYYGYLFEEDNREKLKNCLKSLSPEGVHFLHNMRTEAHESRMSLAVSDSDFANLYAQYQGQETALTTIIGMIENGTTE